jgi:glycosyltransferase involved in cell wall biosynthesis
MRNKIVRVLLIDEGMNTGISAASKIGGGQVVRRRFFSDYNFFQTRVLTSEKQIADYWRGLAKIEFDSKLKTYRPIRIHIASLKINWYRLIMDSLQAAKTLNRHLAAANDDVFFINDNKSRHIYILSFLLNGFKKHKALTAIEVDGEWKLGVFDSLMKFLYLSFFDKIICPTDAICKTLGRLGQKNNKKILTAYPGVNRPVKSETLLRQKRNKDVDYVFGCIGTLNIAIKGQDIIIRAVGRLIKKNNHLPLKVYFFGDGPDRQLMEEMIQNIGGHHYFEFKGYEPNQKKIYSQIDACILASRTEVASLVLMECLVRNLPVIAADLDACKEILSSFYGDLFFERGNDKSLSCILDHALKDDVLDKIRNKISNTDKTTITREYQVKRVYNFFRT